MENKKTKQINMEQINDKLKETGQVQEFLLELDSIIEYLDSIDFTSWMIDANKLMCIPDIENKCEIPFCL